jgi:hypothetical protein
MILQQKRIWLFFPLIASLLITSLTIAACGDTPTPKPQPTFALEVSPGVKVQVGQRVAIVAKIEPIEKLSLEWSVSGDAEGKLNTYEGEQVIYIGGKEGTDILVAEGTTASGVSVKQTVILTVVDELVTRTPTPSPTSPSASPPPTLPSASPPPTPLSPSPSPTSPFTSPLSESRIYCTDSGGGDTETLAVEPPRTVVRIRVDIEERATDYGCSLWEVEAYGPDTGNTNLATGGEAKASSEQDSPGCIGCFADLAIDGNMTTRWSSDWYDPQWLEITLPDPQIVNRIVLKWEIAYAREYCVTVIGPVTPSTPTPTDTPRLAAECPFVPPIRIPIEGPSVDAEVRITSMEHCADNLPTATSIPLAGTYSGDLTNKEIWVLVYAPDLKYYPQSTDACANISTPFTNGKWSEIIRLGRESVPEVFIIVTVVTNIGSPASEAFHNYLTVGCKSGSYQGLTLIPSGATELDSIIVHTR